MPGERASRTPLDAFLEAFWRDIEADAIRPLADYLARFPGDDGATAAEYRAFKGRAPRLRRRRPSITQSRHAGI
jgi:hypothetical protein